MRKRKTMGEVAFEAFHIGSDEYDAMPVSIRAAWEHAAQAAITEHERRAKTTGPDEHCADWGKKCKRCGAGTLEACKQ